MVREMSLEEFFGWCEYLNFVAEEERKAMDKAKSTRGGRSGKGRRR